MPDFSIKLTSSSLERAAMCPASEALPHIERAPAPPARRGTAIHEYLRAVGACGREERGVIAALAKTPLEYVEDCKAIPIADIPTLAPGAFAQEVAFAYYPRTDTGVELGRNRGRDYSGTEPGQDVLCGTPDTAAVTAEAGLMWDYKTGWAPLTPARWNWQVKSYALMLARAWQRDLVMGGLLRIRPEGEPWYDRATFDMLDLEEIAAQVRGIFDGVRKARMASRPKVVEGDHCTYCPAFAHCPAKQGYLERLARVPEDLELPAVLDQPGFVLTEDNAQLAYLKLVWAEAALKKARGIIEQYAAVTPIPLGEGYVFGTKQDAGHEKIDPELARPVLERLYGAEVAERAVETKVQLTKKSLRASLQEWIKTTPTALITKTVEGAHAALRAAGAMSKPPGKTSLCEFKPKELPSTTTPALPEETTADATPAEEAAAAQ